MDNKRYFILRFRCRHKEMLFRREADFLNFLRLYEKRLHPFVATYSWSFTPEQAMFLAATKQEDNHRYIRKAGELLKRYRRYHRRRNKGNPTLQKKVIHLPQPDEAQLRETITHIHCLPLQQGYGENFVEYPWTSYLLLLSKNHTWLQADEVMEWFGSRKEFRHLHHRTMSKNSGEKESVGENFY